eukprot:symbB.v1.2.001822.t1/scaffold97.1/size333048/26
MEAVQGKADNVKKLQQLPLSQKQKEQLILSKYAFEDLLKLHGENVGITADTQQLWTEALWACQFQAGPSLDRLSASVLAFLSDAEKRRGAGNVQPLRLAWLDLCLACCSVSEKLSRPSFRHAFSSEESGVADSADVGEDGSDSERMDLRRASVNLSSDFSSKDSTDMQKRKHLSSL